MKTKVGSSDKGPTDNPNPHRVLIGTPSIAYLNTLMGVGAVKSSMYLMKKKSIQEEILPSVKKYVMVAYGCIIFYFYHL